MFHEHPDTLAEVIAHLERTVPAAPPTLQPSVSADEVAASYWLWRGKRHVIEHLKTVLDPPGDEE
jgi:hypothetical protein